MVNSRQSKQLPAQVWGFFAGLEKEGRWGNEGWNQRWITVVMAARLFVCI